MILGDLKGPGVAARKRCLDMQTIENCLQRIPALVETFMKGKSEVEEWSSVCVK